MDRKDKRPEYGGKEPPGRKTTSSTESTSSSEIPTPSTSNATSPKTTTDHREDKSIGNDNGNLDINENSNGFTGCRIPIQLIGKPEAGMPLSQDEGENSSKSAEKQKLLSDKALAGAFPMSAFRETDLSPGKELPEYTAKEKINNGADQAKSRILGALSLSQASGAGPSESTHSNLPTPDVEVNVSFEPISNKYTHSRVPWSSGGRRTVSFNASPTPQNGTARNGLGNIQFGAVTRTEHAGMPMGMGSAILREPETGMWTGRTERLFNRAPGMPLLPMSGSAHTSRPGQALPRNTSLVANNDNWRSTAGRAAVIGTVPTNQRAASFLNPAIQPFSQVVTQTVHNTPANDYMGHAAFQLLPSPDHFNVDNSGTQDFPRTPSVQSTIRVRRDDSSSPDFESAQDRFGFEVTGYRRSDPTILWADSMPPAIVAPQARYPASRLLGAGFLRALDFQDERVASTRESHSNDLDSPFEFDIDAYDGAPEVSFVNATTPATVPAELASDLVERAERERCHAERDAWRRLHAHEVVRRHEEFIFAKPAAEGEYGLKEWHMSSEYHGQSGHGKGGKGGRGGGSGGVGRGGKGGWGGRGRGGMGMGMGMASGSRSAS